MGNKNLLLVILFFSSTSIIGQNIYFLLYGKCSNGSVFPIEIYVLEKDSIKFSSWDSTCLVLPDTGVYNLNLKKEKIPIYINKIGLNTDTISFNPIEEYLEQHPQPDFYWFCCSEKCSGYQIDYYNNGNIRVEGLFKKGKAIGEIKYYNVNGTLSTILYYNKRGKYLRRKDFAREL